MYPTAIPSANDLREDSTSVGAMMASPETAFQGRFLKALSVLRSLPHSLFVCATTVVFKQQVLTSSDLISNWIIFQLGMNKQTYLSCHHPYMKNIVISN